MKTVLLLEDEPLIAMSIEDGLQAAGYVAVTEMSRAGAHGWLDTNRPDAVIVDVLLQDGSSEDVASRIKAAEIPFVVHSGDLRDMHVDTAFAAGVWVSKPSSGSDLVEALASLLLPSRDEADRISSPEFADGV